MEMNLSEEQRFVVEAFQCGFKNYHEKTMVLYGIGKNTEAILNMNHDFKFAGLMDAKSTGEIVYKYKVLTFDEVISLKPIVVIIARESVVNIIYKRIQFLSIEYNIEIYNYKGELLRCDYLGYKNESLTYWKNSEEELREKIRNSKIVSFDIFDTLIMRKVLEPQDIFDVVEKRLEKEYDITVPFKKMRVTSEQSVTGIPTFKQIYQMMQIKYKLDSSVISIMRKIEIQVEKEFIIPRKKVVDLYHFALRLGKSVYLISDMYFSKVQIQELLSMNGIYNYIDIFVSGEIGYEKCTGELYQYYTRLVGKDGLLHIGDNRRSDIVCAIENGLEAYNVYSSYELLMASSFNEILSDISGYEQRLIMGLLISNIFNDPFSISGTNGKIEVSDFKMLGYFFIAPLMSDFMVWLMERLQESEIEQLLFPSRDGYLINLLYEIFSKQVYFRYPSAVYFKTSRRALTVSAIHNKEDIFNIIERKFTGTLGELLKVRFGLIPHNNDLDQYRDVNDTNKSEIYEYILSYEHEIYRNARRERDAYLSYLTKRNLINDKKQGVFDFVASGTVQFFLSKLLDKDLEGFYFATMNVPNDMLKKDSTVSTAFGNIKSYGSLNHLGRHYLMLETVLVDYDLTLVKLDIDGQMVFEDGENNSIKKIMLIQQGIIKYAKEYAVLRKDSHMQKVSLNFVDNIFGLLFTNNCIVDQFIKDVFKNDDKYDGMNLSDVWAGKY